MEIQVYSVYDVKAEAYMQPIFVQNEAIARRAFGNSIKDPTSPLGKNPEDYYLALVGIWDDQAGQFREITTRMILNGLAVQERE